MITAIGEVLIDEFPSYSRIGGAPFNFCVNVHRLGEKAHLITRIGDDAAGRRIMKMIDEIGIDAAGVQTDRSAQTGRVQITMEENGDHRFRILPGAAFDGIQPAPSCPISRMVYFGSLAQRTDSGFKAIQNFITSQPPDVLRFLDINLRPGCFTQRVIERSLTHADVLKLNDGELQTIKAMLSPRLPTGDVETWLMRRFDISLIALTLGARGAELITPQGRRYRAVASDVDRIVDTVGAGDAFSAVLAVGLIRKRPLDRILEAANRFAAAVCSTEGALPDDRRFYDQAAALIGGDDNEK
jgi:fructokinase